MTTSPDHGTSYREGTDWREKAACLGEWDLFHGPEEERKRDRNEREAIARAICARCPVIAECAALAAEVEHGSAYVTYGVWAGTTEGYRREVARGRK